MGLNQLVPMGRASEAPHGSHKIKLPIGSPQLKVIFLSCQIPENGYFAKTLLVLLGVVIIRRRLSQYKFAPCKKETAAV